MIGHLFETHVLGQILRHVSNKAQDIPLYYFRDHYGHEVDLLIRVGEKLKLIGCKWSENPSVNVPGLREIEGLIGDKNIISRSIITSMRGQRRKGNISIEDSVDLACLE
jgi:predicted AAA+ superfamily ATPase